MNTRRLLERAEIFKGLLPNELAAIACLTRERGYKAGEVVFEENTQGHSVYIVGVGRVSIGLGMRLDSKSETAIIYTMTGGESFGELTLIDNGLCTATARCETDCRILEIRSSDFYALCESDNHVGYTVFRNLAMAAACRLRNVNLQLAASICSEMQAWY